MNKLDAIEAFDAANPVLLMIVDTWKSEVRRISSKPWGSVEASIFDSGEYVKSSEKNTVDITTIHRKAFISSLFLITVHFRMLA